MARPRFIDDINRLFDELVGDPWGRPVPAGRDVRRPLHGKYLEVEVPTQGAGRDDIAVTTEGRRLTVAVRRRSAQTTTGRGTELSEQSEEQYRQTFTLPEGMDLSGFEAHFDRGVLRIRIGLRERH